MNSHHRLEFFRRRSSLSLCRFVLSIALYNSAFFGSEAALTTFSVEELCRAQKTAAIDLRQIQSGILTSSTSGAQELTCDVQLQAGVNSSVVLSLNKYSLEPQDELIIEVSQNFKVALIGEGEFPEERTSFQSDGSMTVHYSTKNRASDYGDTRTKFQLTFTHVHRSPCSYEEFKCRNLNCIPKKLLCNQHNNCGDNSDEGKCGPEELEPKVKVYKQTCTGWMASNIVSALLLGMIIIAYGEVLIRRTAVKNIKAAKNVASSAAPPVRSFDDRKPDNRQVPSM